MSTLRTNALEGVDAKNSITIVAGVGNITTTNVQKGLAKVFINMDGTGTIATRDSLNIASITDSATGNYQHNSTNAMSSDDYACVYNSGNGAGGSDDSTNPGNGFASSHPNTSSQIAMETSNDEANNVDRDYIGGSWHGDLA